KEAREHPLGIGEGPGKEDGIAKFGTEGWYDWEFVRPITERTSPEDSAGDWRCPACGAPYRSDLDLECAHCHHDRPRPAAGWTLVRSWLVLDTDFQGDPDRLRHDARWALRGAGKIAIGIGAAALGGS